MKSFLLALQATDSVVFNKLLNLLEPQFFHL